MRKFTSVFFSLLLTIMLVQTAVVPAAVPVLANGGVQVSIDAPDFVASGSNFTATVNITDVINLGSANYTISFNSTVLQLDNVAPGSIGPTQILVDSFPGSEGTYTITQSVTESGGASGFGFLAVLKFHAIGNPDTSSNINLSNGLLRDKASTEIPVTTWLPDSVSVLPPPGGPHHFDFNFIEHQDTEQPFPITITAKDTFNDTDTMYDGINTLSDSTGTIMPDHTDNFTGGVWTGDVTITQPFQGNVITTSGGGSGGISNSFDIVDAVQADFHLTIPQNTFMLAAGENITTSFDVTSMNNFEGTVNLYFYGPPVIENVSSISPTSVNLTAGGTESVTLNLGASAQTPAETYWCEIEGISDNFSDELFLTVNVGAAGQPLLMASPSMVAIGEDVTFSVSQFPPGEIVQILWGDGPLVGTVITSGNATDGTWTSDPVTITGNVTSGDYMIKAVSASAIAHFTITIIGAGEDFLVNVTPDFLSLLPGDVAYVDVNIQSVGDFNSQVTLSASVPPGVNYTFDPASVTPPANGQVSATMTITVEEWIAPDMYCIGVESDSQDPPIHKFRDLMLDIIPPGEWGPSISLSQSYGLPGDIINITGSNFMSPTNSIVTIREIYSGTIVDTQPTIIYLAEGGTFSAQLTVPDAPPGNYQLEARVEATSEFAEKDFQIMGAGSTFSVSVSPWSTSIVTEPGKNSSTVSISLFSIGGSSSTVNLYLEGIPPWLTYRFGSLSENTPATGGDAITIPAGGSTSVSLN
ncbi:cohesin domain-containing protein, partial [Chloroflexota bacterium]